jgi:hypothetical protein
MLPHLSFAAVGVSFLSSVLATAVDLSGMQDDSRLRYTRAHSLGDDYAFDARDGWTTLNVTDMQYKYSRSLASYNTDHGYHRLLEDDFIPYKRTSRKDKSVKKKKSKSKSKSNNANAGHHADLLNIDDSMKNPLDSLSSVFHAVGAAEPVTITWCV